MKELKIRTVVKTTKSEKEQNEGLKTINDLVREGWQITYMCEQTSGVGVCGFVFDLTRQCE